MGNSKTNIFISYSHKDKRWLTRLQTHLRPLIRNGDIDLWDDTQLTAGSDWRNSIRIAIDKASVAILLVSADFLASDFIHEDELPPLLEKAKNQGTLIFPIIVSSCRFQETLNISKFQAVNDPATPMNSLSRAKQEQIFLDLTKKVEIMLPSNVENLKFTKIGNLDSNSEIKINKATQIKHVSEIAVQLVEKISENANRPTRAMSAIPTGFHILDELTGGLQGSDLFVIASGPHGGLTSFGLSLINRATDFDKITALLFSSGIPSDEMVLRIVCSDGRINVNRLRGGYLTREEWKRFGEAVNKVNSKSFFVDDTLPQSFSDLEKSVTQFKKENDKLDLVVIDNVEIFDSFRADEIAPHKKSTIFNLLKKMASEQNVSIVALYQTPSVEIANNLKPSTPDLLKLGIFEQSVDVAGFLFREDLHHETAENQGIVELIIAKNKKGPTGLIRLAFIKEHSTIADLFE